MKPLHDGSKIYDTPKYTGEVSGIIAGYNCGFTDRTPTYAVGSNAKFTAYWERILFRDVLSILDFDIPEDWDRDFTLWVLFRNGFFAILKDAEVIDEKGMKLYTATIPQACTLAGKNVFYRPTRAVVANPRIKTKQWRIGVDCAVIKLSPDYDGIWGIVHQYAETLAELTQSLKTAILNTRMVDGYVVDKNADAALVNAVMSGVEAGKPFYIVQARLEKGQDGELQKPWAEFHNDVGRNYVIDKLQTAIETELNAFKVMIGVPILSDKKERLNVEEVNTTVGYAQSEIDVYFDTLKRSIEEAKRVFPNLAFDVHKTEVSG